MSGEEGPFRERLFLCGVIALVIATFISVCVPFFPLRPPFPSIFRPDGREISLLGVVGAIYAGALLGALIAAGLLPFAGTSRVAASAVTALTVLPMFMSIGIPMGTDPLSREGLVVAGMCAASLGILVGVTRRREGGG